MDLFQVIWHTFYISHSYACAESGFSFYLLCVSMASPIALAVFRIYVWMEDNKILAVHTSITTVVCMSLSFYFLPFSSMKWMRDQISENKFRRFSFLHENSIGEAWNENLIFLSSKWDLQTTSFCFNWARKIVCFPSLCLNAGLIISFQRQHQIFLSRPKAKQKWKYPSRSFSCSK